MRGKFRDCFDRFFFLKLQLSSQLLPVQLVLWLLLLSLSWLHTFSEIQPFSEKLLGWSCEDECKYSCMWTTVDAFQRDGLNVPQFHGKVSEFIEG